MKSISIALVIALVAFGGILAAQSSDPRSATPAPSFEVASVKRSSPNGTFSRQGSVLPGGRWQSVNATLLEIIQRAYPNYERPGLIAGVPGWVSRDVFDIDATAGRDVAREQMLLMLRQLLADRFKLKVHTEPRQVDVYVLTVLRRDGRLGPRLKPASAECLASIEASLKRAANSDGRPPCTKATELNGTLVRLRKAGTIPALATALQTFVGRPVVDRTGLAGVYEYDLEITWRPMDLAGATSSAGTGGDSLFTQVREQLGLKLEAGREPGEVLVIDRVESPTPN